MIEQVARDHELLRERILRLGGQAGITRLEAGLAAARAAAEQQTLESSSSTSPSELLCRKPQAVWTEIAHFSSQNDLASIQTRLLEEVSKICNLCAGVQCNVVGIKHLMLAH